MDIKLYGRIFIETTIEAKTGLHIGGAGADLEIGGLDKEVIRDPITNRPYIPGSSLRGKMRSQMEKLLGLPQNRRIGQVYIHTCETYDEFSKNGGCPVCTVFGVPAELDYNNATRLVVRDAMLSEESEKKLRDAHTDLEYTELKTEVAIDRVTSKASPRTLERVPAGAEFGPAELVFSIYDPADIGRLEVVLQALQLVEDDYLGGNGSRGYGKVAFKKIKISARSASDYSKREPIAEYANLSEWAAEFEKGFLDKVKRVIFPKNGG